MTGVQEYNKRFEDKIENTLNGKPEFMRGYLNSLSDMSVSSRLAYVGYVNSFVDHVGKQDGNFTYDDFTAYLSFVQRKEDGTETTSSYRIAVYSALKKFSTYLYVSGRINRNFMADIKRPKAIETQETIDKRSIGYLTKKETKTYLKDVQAGVGSKVAIGRQRNWKERDELIIMILLSTGIRCSALSKLDMESIDEENMTVTVTDKGSRTRTINLPENVIKVYLEWKEKRSEIIGSEDVVALFVSNQKKRMDQSSISRVVKKYSANIEGKNITPHKLRATYGTQIYDATKDIVFTQKCMGHNNSKTTELYIRNKNNVTKEAASIMSGIIG